MDKILALHLVQMMTVFKDFRNKTGVFKGVVTLEVAGLCFNNNGNQLMPLTPGYEPHRTC